MDMVEAPTRLAQIYKSVVLISGLTGALFGFLSELNEEKRTESTITTSVKITGSTFMCGVFGIGVGLTSPLTMPVMIPAFICIKIKQYFFNK